MFRYIAFLFLVPLVSVAQKAPPAQAWQKIGGCQLVQNRWNDGDSFHTLTEGKEMMFRLYFVDTPEAETEYAERTTDQAAYFGISEADAVKLGEAAAAFTKQKLTNGFTVQTRWHKALGRSNMQRYYALVDVNGQSLAELLVSNGLARIFGTRTVLPDGRDSRTYLAYLTELEARAKAAKLGGWKGQSSTLSAPLPGSVPVVPSPSLPRPAQSTSTPASPTGTDFDSFFKKPQPTR
jgi:endonuclease YncB( thermonuclease family)